MTQYRNKPIVIEAEPYKPGMEDGFSCIPYVSACQYKNPSGKYKQCNECYEDIFKKPYIGTPMDGVYIDDGDLIITCENGVRYPIKADIFEETYELVALAPTSWVLPQLATGYVSG